MLYTKRTAIDNKVEFKGKSVNKREEVAENNIKTRKKKHQCLLKLKRDRSKCACVFVCNVKAKKSKRKFHICA